MKTRKRTSKEQGESKALNIADFQNAVKGKNLYRDGALIGEATNVRRIAGKDGATFSVLVKYGGTHFSEVSVGDRKVMAELAEKGNAACINEEGRFVRTFTLKEKRR